MQPARTTVGRGWSRWAAATGCHAMLRALVRLDVDLTAIVTVADDGGSSGRLRRENGRTWCRRATCGWHSAR